MKDEEYIFREDVREKAITARSAKKRSRRSGSRFPHYTEKEVRAMSGPTYTVKMGKPMSYEAFKALPESLQKDYIKDILSKYNVGTGAIAEVFGIAGTTCTTKLHKLGFRFPKGFKPNRDDLARLREDFGLAPTKKTTLESVSFSFSGAFDPANFVRQLKVFIPEGKALKVSVVVEVAESESSTT